MGEEQGKPRRARLLTCNHRHLASKGLGKNQSSFDELATKFPYDILRHIFLNAAPVSIRRFHYWSVTSVPDLISLALVCKSWTLPAQHVYFLSIDIKISAALEQFASVAASRPDLSAKLQAL